MAEKKYSSLFDSVKRGEDAFVKLNRKFEPEQEPEEPTTFEKLFQPDSPKVRAWRRKQSMAPRYAQQFTEFSMKGIEPEPLPPQNQEEFIARNRPDWPSYPEPLIPAKQQDPTGTLFKAVTTPFSIPRVTNDASILDMVGNVAEVGLAVPPLSPEFAAINASAKAASAYARANAPKVAGRISQVARELPKGEVGAIRLGGEGAEEAAKAGSGAAKEGQGVASAGVKEGMPVKPVDVPPQTPIKTATGAPPNVPPVKPPTATGAMPEPIKPQDSVNKLVQATKDIDAKTLRRQTEIVRTQERRERAGIVAGALEGGKGSQAFSSAKGAIKGRLAFPEFVAPEKQLTGQDIFNLNEMVRTSQQRPFTKLSTQDALVKLLAGELPTRNEMGLLEEVFGAQLGKELMSKRALGPKVYEAFLDSVGLLKALKASVDLSAPLRQGATLIGEPTWWKSWKPMLKSFGSEEDAVNSVQKIMSNDLFPLLEKAELYIAPWGKEAIRLGGREESFMSRFAQRLPWVKWSERAYVTYLNELRAGTFYKYAAKWRELPLPKSELDDKLAKLADFINKSTGRGNIAPFNKGDIPVIANAVFFSPRFVASRFQTPFALFTKDAEVRKVVAKNLAEFVGAGLTVLSLAKLSGAEVETDPHSTDFGKIRIGNTRYDAWAGYQQIARYATQFVTATGKATDTGKYYHADRIRTLERFGESKLAPAAGLLISALKGKNFIGEPMDFTTETAKREAINMVTPMFVSDMVEAIKDEGLIGLPMAIPGGLGVSVSTYEDTPKSPSIPNIPSLNSPSRSSTKPKRKLLIPVR